MTAGGTGETAEKTTTVPPGPPGVGALGQLFGRFDDGGDEAGDGVEFDVAVDRPDAFVCVSMALGWEVR